MTLYKRDHCLSELEPYYSQHVSAMTTEALFSKSDIAAELAWRDRVVDDARKSLVREGRNNAEISLQLAAHGEILNRLISLYDSGELTTEALSQLVSDARKVVG